MVTDTHQKPLRVVLYLRQSKADVLPDGRLDHRAVDRQREACTRYAKERGWVIIAEYLDNAVSATSRKPRPEFERMMGDAKLANRPFDIVLSWQFDRLTRQPVELERIIELSEATGVKFATVNGEVDLTTDQGRLIGRILGSVARAEMERKSTRQHLADAQRAAKGVLPSDRSFGYVGRELHPAEAEALKSAYHALLGGESVVSITKELTRKGFVGRKTGKPMDRHTVRGILMNARNAGYRGRNGQVQGKGDWPEIVPLDVFEAAAAKLSEPGRRTNHVGTTRRWVGSGTFVCARCGATVKAAWSKYGKRGYRCGVTPHLTRSDAEQIDQYVEAAVARRLLDPELRDLLPDPNSARVRELRAEREALRQREDTLGEAFADGTMTARQVQVANERIGQRLSVLDAELTTLTSGSLLGTMLASEQPAETFRTSPVTIRQKVIKALCQVTLHPRRSGPNQAFDPDLVEIVWRNSFHA